MPRDITAPDLPLFLEEQLRHAAGGPDGAAEVKALMRPAEKLMRIETLKCFKASRLSFADMFCRLMARERWQISLISGEVDDEGAGKFVDRIDAGGHRMTYFATAILICIVFGIPIGVLCARSDPAWRVVRPILDVVMLFGVGRVPGAVAVIVVASRR